MSDKAEKLAAKAKDAITSTVVHVGDLNGDGKVDQEDARMAGDKAKKAASVAGEESLRLGKYVLRSSMVKDAAAGAAICAVIALPFPFVGPLVGAAIGAGLGMYKNIFVTGRKKP